LDQKGRSSKKLEKIIYWEGYNLYSEHILGRVDQIKDETVVNVHNMHGQMRSACMVLSKNPENAYV
jgi:hypothetical protein